MEACPVCYREDVAVINNCTNQDCAYLACVDCLAKMNGKCPLNHDIEHVVVEVDLPTPPETKVYPETGVSRFAAPLHYRHMHSEWLAWARCTHPWAMGVLDGVLWNLVLSGLVMVLWGFPFWDSQLLALMFNLGLTLFCFARCWNQDQEDWEYGVFVNYMQRPTSWLAWMFLKRCR